MFAVNSHTQGSERINGDAVTSLSNPLDISPLDISPHCMKFQKLWIYDLRIFNEFWQTKMQAKKDLIFEKSIWRAVLKAYGLHTFSTLSQLQKFTLDYFDHYRSPISSKQIEKVFHHFHRLGIQKIGHLQKIPFAQIQARWGKDWCEFFRGVLDPDFTLWKWEPYRKAQVLEASSFFEDPVIHMELVKEACRQQLETWSKIYPSLSIEKIILTLGAQTEEGDQFLEVGFGNHPSLKKEFAWILRVLEEHLLHIELQSPLQNISLKLFPKPQSKGLQLSLFQKTDTSVSFQEISEKLAVQGYFAFQPELLPSNVPEDSWRKTNPQNSQKNMGAHPVATTRPLIQYAPRNIPEPKGKLYFTERLHWFDELGKEFKRDYYLWFSHGRWLWIFKNQEDQWLEQGIAE